MFMSIVQPPSRLDLGSPKKVRLVLVLGLKVGRSVWTCSITLVCQIHWKVLRFCAGFCWGSLSRIYTNYNEHASWSDFKDSKCLRGLQEEQSFGVQGRCLLYWLLLLYWSRIGGCRPYWPYWLYWRVLKGCRAVLRCIGCMGGYWCVCILRCIGANLPYPLLPLCPLIGVAQVTASVYTHIYKYKYQDKYKDNNYTNTNLSSLQIFPEIHYRNFGLYITFFGLHITFVSLWRWDEWKSQLAE